MARIRRYFPSNQFYEVIIRARRGLPFATLELVKILLKSALARTQRDDKVTLTHYMWHTNHAHIGSISKDPEQMVRFYSELQKKITDYFKRLLGIDHLNLWEGSPVVAVILDPQAAARKIAYWYANPARANLVDTIEDYPGLSSWRAFQSCADNVDAESCEEVCWIRQQHIRKLPSLKLSARQDFTISSHLKRSAKIKLAFKIYPNAWMKCFGIVDQAEVAWWNKVVRSELINYEEAARTERRLNQLSVRGSRRLKEQAIMQDHVPKKEGRRIFVISSVQERRLKFISLFKQLTSFCKDLFLSLKSGNISVAWPPGMFRPPLGPCACAINFEL